MFSFLIPHHPSYSFTFNLFAYIPFMQLQRVIHFFLLSTHSETILLRNLFACKCKKRIIISIAAKAYINPKMKKTNKLHTEINTFPSFHSTSIA